MGTISFVGTEPFVLVLQKEPTTTAEGKSVAVTLPVFVPGPPEHAVDVRILLSIPQAELLAAQIQPALVTARVNARWRP
jgi:hypothetical protein